MGGGTYSPNVCVLKKELKELGGGNGLALNQSKNQQSPEEGPWCKSLLPAAGQSHLLPPWSNTEIYGDAPLVCAPLPNSKFFFLGIPFPLQLLGTQEPRVLTREDRGWKRSSPRTIPDLVLSHQPGQTACSFFSVDKFMLVTCPENNNLDFWDLMSNSFWTFINMPQSEYCLGF